MSSNSKLKCWKPLQEASNWIGKWVTKDFLLLIIALLYFLNSKQKAINSNLFSASEIRLLLSKLIILSLFSSIHSILSLNDNLSFPKQLAPNIFK